MFFHVQSQAKDRYLPMPTYMIDMINNNKIINYNRIHVKRNYMYT